MQVAYILFRFPSLTETFIAQEILKLRELGVGLRLFSLLPPKKEAGGVAPEVTYCPGPTQPALWAAQFVYFFRRPAQYFRLLGSVLRLPAPDLKFLFQCLLIFFKSVWLARQLEGSAVQLLHAHFAWLPGLAGMLVSQLLDLPLTVTTHAFDIYIEKNNLLELSTRGADAIVTISRSNQQAMCENWPVLRAKRIEVIRCGVDLAYFQPAAARPANRLAQITSVGSLIEKKGHEYLIRACQALKSQGLQFQCVIIGAGELQPALAALIRELDLETCVSLAGPRPPDWVRERLCASDLFVLASVVAAEGDRDGIPVALMEAMALGVPVVSTPVSGIAELVEPDVTGLLAPPRDAPALAAAMARLLDDAPLRERLSGQARQRIESDYDISKNAACLAGLFQQLVAARAKPGL